MSLRDQDVFVVWALIMVAIVLLGLVIWFKVAGDVKRCEAKGGVYHYGGRGSSSLCLRPDAVIL